MPPFWLHVISLGGGVSALRKQATEEGTIARVQLCELSQSEHICAPTPTSRNRTSPPEALPSPSPSSQRVPTVLALTPWTTFDCFHLLYTLHLVFPPT